METIEKLVEKIQKNDLKSYNSLLERFKPMIYSFLKNYHLEEGAYRLMRDDLFQEGSLALLEAARTYQKDKGAHFSTFAYVVIRRRIMRSLYKEYRKYKNEYFSIDAIEQIDHYSYLGYVAEEDNGYVVDKIASINKYRTSLNSEDNAIISLRVQNKSYKEIAQILGISTKRIDNRLQKFKREFLASKEKKNT